MNGSEEVCGKRVLAFAIDLVRATSPGSEEIVFLSLRWEEAGLETCCVEYGIQTTLDLV